jgi:hypothetical protein
MPLSDHEIIEYQRSLAASKSYSKNGLVMAESQDFVILQVSGDVSFMVFVLEKDTTTGAITEKNFGCDSPYSEVILYSTAAGKSAYVAINVVNTGYGTATFTYGITVSEVDGGSAPS